MSYLKIQKSNLKKEKTSSPKQSAQHEKTRLLGPSELVSDSPAQHEKTPLLGPSELVSDSPACSNSDEDEKVKGTISPVLTSSGSRWY